jgi:hypothetical protein
MADEDLQEDVKVEITPAETEAKQFGWVPKDDFKGDPEEWRDADTFLRRGREINGFLRKDMEKLNGKLAQKDAELSEIRATMEEFRKFHNETEARAYTRAIADLKKEKVTAIEQGDGVRVVELDEQIDSLKEAQAKPAVQQKQPVEDPELGRAYGEWLAENTWFNTDLELQELAVDFGDAIKARNPNLLGKEFLAKVTEKVKKTRPDKFENPARNNSTVGSGGQGSGSGIGRKKKSYENLPADAKKECDRFTKTMVKNSQTGKAEPLMTVDQYINEYAWD